MMIVSDPAGGQGAGDAGHRRRDRTASRSTTGTRSARTARDGNITMVGETSPGKFEPVATIPTQRSARTIGADQKAHKLYLAGG